MRATKKCALVGERMKSLISLILAIALTCAPAIAMPKHPESAPQRKAAHQITFEVKRVDDDGTIEVGRGLCTASAIGPHALITATHCDAGQTGLYVDNNTVVYPIVGHIVDGEDHTIFLIGGPAFKDTMGAFYSDKADKVGDRIFLYGDGGGMFPPQYRIGYRMGSLVMTTNDAPEGMPTGELYIFDINIVGGDSGSAIYDEHGKLVTLVTYGIGGHYCGAYPLHFTASQIDQAEKF